MSTYRSPRSSEAQHVKQQECDTNPAGGTVGWPVAGEFANQDGDNKMRQCHEEATPKQQWPSSKPIHRPKTSEYSNKLSDIEDAGHDQLETIVQTHGFEQMPTNLEAISESVLLLLGGTAGLKIQVKSEYSSIRIKGLILGL